MHIGILQVGKVADELLYKYEEFPPMFQELLGADGAQVRFTSYCVLQGVMPKTVEECDGWLVTGSARGVYDTDPWIAEVKVFVQQAREAGKPLVGVCFGHQLMAEAFGGAAVLSEKGWGCGVHEYQVYDRPSWMSDAPEKVTVHAMHRDQVTELPEDATVLAGNAFCEHAMIAYGDPEAPDAISIQPHPEFEREFAEDLVALRTGDGVIPAEVGKPALATFGDPVDNANFANWINAYFMVKLIKKANAA
ncbi:MAG: gamma-glutamyl-gamma-aminobutyrate hydrolase family protein [Pseudomonadota bacterium]